MRSCRFSSAYGVVNTSAQCHNCMCRVSSYLMHNIIIFYIEYHNILYRISSYLIRNIMIFNVIYHHILCTAASVRVRVFYFCSVHPSLSDGAAKVRPDVLSVMHPSASMVHVCVCTLSVLPVPGCSSAIDVTACLTVSENGELLPVISASQKSPLRATGQTSMARPSLVKVATMYSLKG